MTIKFLRTYILSAAVFYSINACTVDNDLIDIPGSTMGTTYSVKIATDNISESATIKSEIDRILNEVNRQMSTYRKDSEISALNLAKAGVVIHVSDDFSEVLQKAFDISKKSGGAFDITVGPLINLWGFGPPGSAFEVPDSIDIARLKQYVGHQNVIFDSNFKTIMKNADSVYIDLSAIAKGFGVDKVCDYLNRKGFKDYLVEIGGEVRASGKNQKGEFWQIGISQPDNSGEIREIIALPNLAVATSGDYRNYFEIEGVRYSHTIDPITGYPVSHNLVGITVIDKDCALADGWATALNLLGPEDGYELAIKLNLPVYMIIKSGEVFIEKYTPDFEQFLIGK